MILIGQQPGDEGRASKFDPEYCMKIRLLAQEGKFPEEWAAHIGVHMATMRNWASTHPEFREAVQIARVLLATWWTNKAREFTDKKGGNQMILVEVLRKRFPELYGKHPKDAFDFILTPEEVPVAAPPPAEGPSLTDDPAAAPVRAPGTMTAEQIRERLAELARRRQQDGGK